MLDLLFLTNLFIFWKTVEIEPVTTNESEIKNEMKAMGEVLREKYKGANVVLSGVVFRKDVGDREINEINDFTAAICKNMKFTFLDPNFWIGVGNLGMDELHLNQIGSINFGKIA